MRRTRRTLTAAQRIQATAFKESVQGRPCIVCGDTQPEMEPHHGIEAQYLRSHSPGSVYDIRNACPICPWWIKPACHGDHTSARRRIERRMLPESVEEFAAELGLVWYLERYYTQLPSASAESSLGESSPSTAGSMGGGHENGPAALATPRARPQETESRDTEAS